MILNLGLAARVVEGVRTHTSTRTGCQTWDAPGIAAALKASDGSPGAALAAALLAAEDPTCRTPNAATFAAHWPQNAATTRPAPRHSMRCPDHPHSDMPCPECAADVADGLPAHVREAWQALQTGRPTHSTDHDPPADPRVIERAPAPRTERPATQEEPHE